MVVRPVNVQWDVVRYDDIETPLFTTDHQKIIDPSHTSGENLLYKLFYAFLRVVVKSSNSSQRSYHSFGRIAIHFSF